MVVRYSKYLKELRSDVAVPQEQTHKKGCPSYATEQQVFLASWCPHT